MVIFHCYVSSPEGNGCINTRNIYLNDPKNTLSFFFPLIVFSGGELPVDKKCDFSSFLWVWKHPWLRVNRCHLLFSFPFIVFHFALISFHVSFYFAFISCHFAFMSFHVPSLVIKDTGLRKLICSNWSSGYPPKRSRFFIFRYRFCYHLASFSYRLEACAGCHLQASWTCTCKSLLSFFFLTLIIFWAGNALAVLRCKPSYNEMPRVIILSQLYLTTTIEKDLSNKIWGYLTCKNGDLTIINGKSIYGSWISTSQNWFHTSYIPLGNRVAMKGGSKRVSQGMEPCNPFSLITWKLTWPDKPQKNWGVMKISRGTWLFHHSSIPTYPSLWKVKIPWFLAMSQSPLATPGRRRHIVGPWCQGT